MFRIRFISLLLALGLVLGLSGTALAAQVDSDCAYCFSEADFAQEEPLVGICITQLPQPETGTVMLGHRVLQPGDILTAEQLSQMTFYPAATEDDRDASVSYLPIYENRVAPSATVSIAIRGKEDKAPVAQDSTLETYKNLESSGPLKARDPEGQPLTYTLLRAPRRGQVELLEDGTFRYTPKKNKVGVDSFTFTATDPAGNVSREATVTVEILKPTESQMYRDTQGTDCRFEAEWLRNTGLFAGEQIGSDLCFFPEQEVSRGEFLAMVIHTLQIPLEEEVWSAVPQDTPQWLKPYLAAALRSGLTDGWPGSEDGSFRAEQTVTGAEAAVMLQNALDLSVSSGTLEAAEEAEDLPVWAAVSLRAMEENGILLEADAPLTRADAAKVLYRVDRLLDEAPGMPVFRMAQE